MNVRIFHVTAKPPALIFQEATNVHAMLITMAMDLIVVCLHWLLFKIYASKK